MLFNLIDFIYDSVLSLLLLLSFKALVFSLFYISSRFAFPLCIFKRRGKEINIHTHT